MPETVSTKKRRIAIPLGYTVIFFALIGLAAAVYMAAGLGAKLLDKSALYEEYTHFIEPLANLDPMPFEDITTADPDTIIEACVMAAFEAKKAAEDEFEEDEMGRTILPQTDVEQQCRRLFGTDFELEHRGFRGFEYSEDQKCYHMPPSGYMRIFIPKVVRSEHREDVTTLYVDYYSNEWLVGNSENQQAAAKQMEYTLRGKKGKEVISAVKLGEVTE